VKSDQNPIASTSRVRLTKTSFTNDRCWRILLKTPC
jgi:hypothetical protein